MLRLLECDCGFTLADRDPEALIEAARAHARELHNMEIEPEVLRASMTSVAEVPRRNVIRPLT